jgi:molecular chaperone DnaK (HSP70)
MAIVGIDLGTTTSAIAIADGRSTRLIPDAAGRTMLPSLAVIAERLSPRHTGAHGHRAFDVLHVATALHLGAREFLTFDVNQRKLAAAEKLKVKL